MYYLVTPCSIIGHTFQLICSVLRTGEVHQEYDGVYGDSEVEDKLEQAQDQSEDAAAESCDPSPSLVRGQCAAGKGSFSLPSSSTRPPIREQEAYLRSFSLHLLMMIY